MLVAPTRICIILDLESRLGIMVGCYYDASSILVVFSLNYFNRRMLIAVVVLQYMGLSIDYDIILF